MNTALAYAVITNPYGLEIHYSTHTHFVACTRSQLAQKLRALRKAGAYIWRTDCGYAADWQAKHLEQPV
jgi:hypothetical protein